MAKSDNRATLKPARPDLIVRHPGARGRPLAPEGEEVELSTHWRRRLRVGDVVIVTPAKGKANPKAEN